MVKNSDILNCENIFSELPTRYIGRKLIHFDIIESTNDYAKTVANASLDGTVIISEEQSFGRGRLGKKWNSKPYESILMSIILKPTIEPTKVSFLTVLTAVSIAKALRKLNIKVGIKWPNDILLNGKKICGILTELCLESEKVGFVVVGIGINVKNEYFDESIKDIATSLYKEGYKIERKYILREILKEFDENYTSYINGTLDIQDVVNTYKEYSLVLNKNVFIVKNNEKELVKCIDINLNGNLIIKDLNNNERVISAGEISIRGENGYI